MSVKATFQKIIGHGQNILKRTFMAIKNHNVKINRIHFNIFGTELKLTTRRKLERNKTEVYTFRSKFIFSLQLLES